MNFRTLIIKAFTLVAMWLFGCQGENASLPGREGSKPRQSHVVVVVNGDPIYRKEFEALVKHAESVFTSQHTSLSAESRAVLSEKILEKMIDAELLAQHARAIGLSDPADGQLADELERVFKAGGQEASFYRFLQDSGLDRKRLMAHLGRDWMIRQLTGQLRKQLTPTDQGIASYYREHPDEFREPGTVVLAHILCKKTVRGEGPMRRAQKVKAAIRSGLTFTKAVKRYSDDELTRQEGGLLGNLKQGEMLAELENIAFSIQEGAVSDPVATKLGVHLLKVVKRKPGKTVSLEKALDKVRAKIEILRIEEKLGQLARSLRQKAVVRTPGARVDRL